MSEPVVQNNPARGVSYLYMAAAFVIVVAGMRAAEPILNPLLLAIFLAVISTPAYFALLKRKYSQWLALLIVMGVLSCTVLGVTYIVTKSISGFTSQQEHYEGQLNERSRAFRRQVDGMVPAWVGDLWKRIQEPNEFTGEAEMATDSARNTPPAEEETVPDDAATASVDDGGPDETAELFTNEDSWKTGDSQTANESLLDYIWNQIAPSTWISWLVSIAGSIGQLLGNTFLILLTVIFILLEAGTFRRKIREAFNYNDDATARSEEIIGSMQNYVVIKTWVSLVTGLLIGVWLWFLGVPYFALWGLLAFLFNFVPNVGSIIAAVPAVLIAWLELTAMPAAAAAIGFIIVNAVVGNFIEPRLMGKGLGLSPLVVFFSMVFWGWVLGPVGMLLSVPLTMTARIALGGFDDTRWIATLMGNVEA